MIGDAFMLTVGGRRPTVAVTRKAIKNLHLGVYPPVGDVRVAAPASMTTAAIRTAVALRLPWLRRQIATFAAQEREPPREYASGGDALVPGPSLSASRSFVRIAGGDWIEVATPHPTDCECLGRTLDAGNPRELRARVEPMVDRWAEHFGLQESAQLKRLGLSRQS